MIIKSEASLVSAQIDLIWIVEAYVWVYANNANSIATLRSIFESTSWDESDLTCVIANRETWGESI